MKKKERKIFRILYIYFIMNFGNRIGEFGLLFYLWVTINSPLIIGIIFFVESLMNIISGYLYSRLTRKIRKSLILKLTYAVRTMTFLFFFLYFYIDFEAYFILILIMIFHSISDSFLSPLIHSSVIHIVEKNKLHKVNSSLSLIDNTSLFLSPVIGALLITLSNDNFVVLFTTVILLLGSGLYFIFRWKEIIPTENDIVEKQKISESIKSILGNKKSSFVLIIFILLNFTLFPLLNIIFPALVVNENNEGSDILALFEIAFATGLIIVSFSQLLTSKSNSELYLILAIFVCSIGYLILGLNTFLVMNLVGVFIIGATLSLIRIHNNTFFQLTLDPKLLSDFFAIRSVLLNSLGPLSIAFTALFIEFIPVNAVIILYSGLIFILGTVFFFTFKFKKV